MNQQATIGTALIVPEGKTLVEMFKEADGLNLMISELERRALEDVAALNVDTAKGRKAISSIAYKVARSKTELVRQGKALTEKQRAEIAVINASRIAAETRLNLLRDKIKQPVMDWEEREKTRVGTHQTNMQAFQQDRVDATATSIEIQPIIDEIQGIEINGDWEEFQALAKQAKAEAIDKYNADMAIATDREKQIAKIAQLEAEAAEKDRIESERLAKEQAAKDKAAEEEHAKTTAKEAEEAARLEKEEQAAREAQIKAEAEEKAQAIAEAAAVAEQKKHEADLKAETDRADKAIDDERARVAKEEADRDAARNKREADEKHLETIKSDITFALEPLPREQIAAAIMDGRIPHITVNI